MPGEWSTCDLWNTRPDKDRNIRNANIIQAIWNKILITIK